jgi:hypothetical protein
MKATLARLAWIAGIIVALVALAGAFRWLGVFFLLGCAVLAIFLPRYRTRRFGAFAVAGFIFWSLLPFDISFKARPGPPRFVKVVHGYPTQEAREAARRGELLLGGCNVTINDPNWILIW